MSRHISALANVVRGVPLRAIGEAVGRAVALTDTELITVKAQWLRTHVERFRLGTMTRVRTIPNPHARLLQVEFGGTTPRTVTLLFSARATADFNVFMALLRRRLGMGVRGRLIELATVARRRHQIHAVRTTRRSNLVGNRALAGGDSAVGALLEPCDSLVMKEGRS